MHHVKLDSSCHSGISTANSSPLTSIDSSDSSSSQTSICGSTFGLSRLKPIAMTSDPNIFRLDMSFNRHGPNRNDQRRFACTIDPLVLNSATPCPSPKSSSDMSNASPLEWQLHYAKWRFPIRTDSPRGLTWGPYHESNAPHPTIPSRPSSSSSASCGTKRSRNTFDINSETPAHEIKRRRILPILRDPLIVRLRIAKTTYHEHEGVESSSSAFSPDSENTLVVCLKHFVNVMVSPKEPMTPIKSRITPCAAGQLKCGA